MVRLLNWAEKGYTVELYNMSRHTVTLADILSR
jgi:hypothetical protein